MDASPALAPTADQGSTRRGVACTCLLAAAALLIALRLHAFDLPLETDECNYAYIGGRLLAGDRLYVDVWDHQPPGVFVLFAGLIRGFGDAPEVFRWTAVLFSLASLGLVFLMLRRLAGGASASTGAILFALASSDPGTAGEGCNREIYLNTLILAAWYGALRGAPGASACARSDADRRGPAATNPAAGLVVASGGCLALASSIKTIVAVHWVALAVWIGANAWGAAPARGRLRAVLRSVALFACGPAVLWASTAGYFGATGRLSDFVDAVFVFNLSYSGNAEGFFPRFLRFFAPERHPFIFESARFLWIGAIGATLYLLVEVGRRRNQGASLILLLMLAGYVSACLPGRFWPHYYYLLVPPAVLSVSLAAGLLVTGAARFAGAEPVARRLVAIGLYAVVPLGLTVTQYRDYWSQPPFGITVKRYNSRDFWGRAQGENVSRVTDPEDEIFVFSNDAEIYYYARRRCASRFTMITGIQSGFAGAKRRREILLADLRERLPRLILVLFDEPPFEAWRDFLARYYGAPIGWDRHDRTREPIMFVFARKGAPVSVIDWDWDRKAVGGWFPDEERP